MANSHDSRAWGDGAAFGLRFAKFASATEGTTAKALREYLAALKSLRSGHTDSEWRVWSGRDFGFDNGGFGTALSLVAAIYVGPKFHMEIGDLNSAKEVCFPIWSVWLAPDRPARVLEPEEIERLKQPDFVRGFADAAARTIPAEANEKATDGEHLD